MPRLLTLILVLLSTPAAFASGWNDYQLEIDPGFKIFRANSLDVALGRSNGLVILSPRDHPGVGPINAYCVTPTHILTRHHGRAPRNLFAGDSFENVDTTKQFFFVTAKADESVAGPFDEQTFLSQPAVQAVDPVPWVAPSNPNVARPLMGSLRFVVISAIVLRWPIIVLLLTAGAILLVWHRLARGRMPSNDSATYP